MCNFLFCKTVNIHIRPSDDFSNSAIIPTVSDIIHEDWVGRMKRENLDGIYWQSQNKTPVSIAVEIPEGIYIYEKHKLND